MAGSGIRRLRLENGRRGRSFEGGMLGTATALRRWETLLRCIAVRKIIMTEQDWIELARKAREAAEQSLREEAFWLRLIADGRNAKLVDAAKRS